MAVLVFCLSPGAAFIDVISPCVAFNNHAGSTKSYEYVRDHNEVANRLDFVPCREEIVVDYEAGGVLDVEQHDGSVLRLRKLAATYDARDRTAAIRFARQTTAEGKVATGLLYVDPEPRDLHAHLRTVATPFNQLGEAQLCPGGAALEKINAALR